MDGENHGWKTLLKYGMIWGENPLFLETPIGDWGKADVGTVEINFKLLMILEVWRLQGNELSSGPAGEEIFLLVGVQPHLLSNLSIYLFISIYF